MASSISGTSANWSITSPAGQLAGAQIGHANASLQDDGTVVIKGADGVMWAGNIMTLGGLTGATPALRFADLLNNFLTGLLSGAITIANNPGSGEALVNGTAPNYLIRRIRAGTRIFLSSSTPDEVVIGCTLDLATGASPGARVYNQSGSTYTFRRLRGGTGITVTEGAGSNPTVFDSTVAVVGATDSGEDIVTGASPTYSVKRFKAGTNVTLSSDATSVTINSTGGGAAGLINQQLISVTSSSTYPTPSTNWLVFGEVASSGVGTSPPTLSGVGSVINATGWYRCFAQVRLGNTSTAGDFTLFFALSTDPTNSIDGGSGIVNSYPASSLRNAYWIEANAFLTSGDIVGLRITPLSSDAQVVSLRGGFQRIN